MARPAQVSETTASTTYRTTFNSYAPADTELDRRVLAALANKGEQSALAILAAAVSDKGRFTAVRTAPGTTPILPTGHERVTEQWGDAVLIQFLADTQDGVNYRGFTVSFADGVPGSMQEFVIQQTGTWLDEHLAN